MWAGDWRRAYDYGDPQAEALAVHESAGLIDVSTLGKLIVRGPQAGEFLDRLYPNRFANLKPGRIRYGVLTSDAGRIMDDGTICRLDDESFYVTTTSSGAGAVEQWFSWWLADWRMEVALTDVTQGLAAVNLAGPARPRDHGPPHRPRLLQRGLRLPRRQARAGRRRARRCCCASASSARSATRSTSPPPTARTCGTRSSRRAPTTGSGPFGLEPQRILRLQKMHILVGQDTDSESTPFGAAMPWIVKLDKDEDFIGKWALEHAAEHPSETALVGFTLPDGDVPTEGAAVLDARGEPIGQVTSARHSRQLGQVIGMAWVPAAMASDGAAITISDDSRRLRAEVLTGRSTTPTARCCAREPRSSSSSRSGAAVARSPMEGQALAAGARMEVRDGWNVAVAYDAAERERLETSVGWADVSHLAQARDPAPRRPRARRWPPRRPRRAGGAA